MVSPGPQPISRMGEVEAVVKAWREWAAFRRAWEEGAVMDSRAWTPIREAIGEDIVAVVESIVRMVLQVNFDVPSLRNWIMDVSSLGTWIMLFVERTSSSLYTSRCISVLYS